MDPALELVLTTYSLTLLHINRRKKLLQEYLVFKRNRRKRKAVFVVVFSAGFGYRNIGRATEFVVFLYGECTGSGKS